MKKRNNFIVLFIFSIVSINCFSNNKLEYIVNASLIDNNKIDICVNIKNTNSFDTKFTTFDFGGFKYSVSNLKIINLTTKKKCKYKFDKKNKKIKIKTENVDSLQLTYTFFSVMGKVWNGKCNSFGWGSDYWYPVQLEKQHKIISKITIPKNYKLICEGIYKKEEINNISIVYSNNSVYQSFFSIFILNKNYFIEKSFNDSLDYNISFFLQDSIFEETVPNLSIDINNALSFFSSYLYKFPYDSLNIVELRWRMRGNTIFGSSVLVDSSSLFYDDNRIILHEICHIYTTENIHLKKGVAYYLLNESLTEYLMLTYIRKTKGLLKYETTMDNYYKSYLNHIKDNNDISLYDLQVNKKYIYWTIYRKGPYILHKLAKSIGYNKWDLFINEILTKNKGKEMSFELFSSILKEYTSNEQFAAFLIDVKSYGIINE